MEVSQEGILLHSGNDLFLFSCKGQYLHSIGREGHGHGEHGRILSVCADAKEKRVYVLSFGGQLTAYGYDGTFLWKKTLESPRDYHVISLLYGSDVGLCCEMRRYHSPGIDVCVARIDSLGCLAADTLIYTGEEEVQVSRSSYSISYRYKEEAKLKLDFEERLHAFRRNRSSFTTFNLASLAPSRAELEDMRQQGTLASKRCQVLDIKENETSLFLIVALRNQYLLAVVEKELGEIVANIRCENPKRGGGLPVRGFSSLRFWPSWTDGTTMASIVSPSELDAADLATIYGEHTDVSCAADNNPIVLLAGL